MSLYVDESGAPGAPSVVFLHGIGTSGWMWGRQIAALTDFHCLNVDLPGHGKSNHVDWVSLTDTADQVATIIHAHAANERAYVVGLSLGAYIGLVLLEHHADRVQRAILSGVTAAPMPNRILLKPQLGLMSILMKRQWFVNMQANSLRVPPHMQSAFTDNLMAMSMQAYRRIWEEVAEFSAPAGLRYVDVPTLITAGGSESEIILRAVDVLSNIMPDAQGRLAPGFRHGWNVEAPDLFNAMLRSWIMDTPLPHRLQAVNNDDDASR